jgi:hypothetical protein
MSNSFKSPTSAKSVPIKARCSSMCRRQAAGEAIYMTFTRTQERETLRKDTCVISPEKDGFFLVFPEARRVDSERKLLRPRPSIRQNQIAVFDHLRMPAPGVALPSFTILRHRSSTFSTPTQVQLPMRVTSIDEISAHRRGSSDSVKQTSPRIPDSLFLPMF